MTFRELEMRLTGNRKRLRVQCRMFAMVAQSVMGSAMGRKQAVPSLKKIVDDTMGPE